MKRSAVAVRYGALAFVITLAAAIDAFSQDKSDGKSKALADKIVSEQPISRGEFFAAMEKRAAAQDKRFDAIDKALASLEGRLAKIEERLGKDDKSAKH